jgi:hypothetical protein
MPVEGWATIGYDHGYNTQTFYYAPLILRWWRGKFAIYSVILTSRRLG